MLADQIIGIIFVIGLLSGLGLIAFRKRRWGSNPPDAKYGGRKR